MKKIAALAVLAAGAATLPNLGFADEGALRVRAGLAGVSYSSPLNSTTDLESSYAALTLGGSYVASSGLFADVGIRKSLGAKWNTKEVVNSTQDDDFSRTETTFTVGKGFGGGWAVFGGLQLSKSEFTVTPGPNNVFVRDESLTQDGRLLFLGVSKAFGVGNGSLSLSGALGVMEQEMKWSSGYKALGNQDETSDSGFGFSLGAAYSHPLTSRVSLVGDLRVQSYAVDFSNSSSEETVGALGLSVVGQF